MAKEISYLLSQEADRDIAWTMELPEYRQAAFLRDLQNDLVILSRLANKAATARDASIASMLQQMFERNYTRLAPILPRQQQRPPLPSL